VVFLRVNRFFVSGDLSPSQPQGIADHRIFYPQAEQRQGNFASHPVPALEQRSDKEGEEVATEPGTILPGGIFRGGRWGARPMTLIPKARIMQRTLADMGVCTKRIRRGRKTLGDLSTTIGNLE